MTPGALPSRAALAWLRTAQRDGWLGWPSRRAFGPSVVQECIREGWAAFDRGYIEAATPTPSPWRITDRGRETVAAEPELAL